MRRFNLSSEDSTKNENKAMDIIACVMENSEEFVFAEWNSQERVFVTQDDWDTETIQWSISTIHTDMQGEKITGVSIHC